MAAGRNRAHILSLRDPQPPILGRAPIPPPPLAAPIDDARHHLAHRSLLLEDRLAAQHREIDALLLDNQRLAATHVALGQEATASRHELRLAAASAEKAAAEKDAEVREVYERCLRVEVEARMVDRMRAELAQVRLDVRELGAAREEFVERLRGIEGELGRAQAELQKAPAIREEIDRMQIELQKGRAAVEYERKAHADNLEQNQAMQKNMISMAREVEKLQAELANAEKRARAAAAAAAANPGHGYAGGYVNPGMQYVGSSYANAYSMQQVAGSMDGGPQYGSGSVSHGPYDMQHSHAHR